MERIASFSVDHTKLKCGMYISRVDGDIVTYDIRTRRPNIDEVMDTGTAHSIEHLFATKIRNCEIGPDVIYFGPMGCRTGFYLLVRSTDHKKAIEMVADTFKWISEYEGDIPGASPIECGNYSDQNLIGAKSESKRMYELLLKWSENELNYEK